MMKQKYKVYKISEIKIEPTGAKFNIPGRILPIGSPLYAIYDSHKEVIYPKNFQKEGETKERCERWTKDNCWYPEDKPFNLSLLKKLTQLEKEQKLEDLIVAENREVYEGNVHNEFRLVFNEKDNFYKFDYYTHLSSAVIIGRWMKESLQISKNKYLCKRVYPVKIVTTRIEFSAEKDNK